MVQHQTSIMQGISNFLLEESNAVYDHSQMYKSLKSELTSDQGNTNNQMESLQDNVSTPVQFRNDPAYKNRDYRQRSLKLNLPNEAQLREFQKIGAQLMTPPSTRA